VCRLNCNYSVMLSFRLFKLLVLVTSLHCTVTSRAPANSDVTYHTFTYLQKPVDALCGRPLLAVILVCSAVANRERRDAIRSSWGAPEALRRLGLRVVYVLGRAEGHNDDFLVEARQHRDVVQADFVDSYSNLSIKSLVGLHWATDYAPCARFVVKTDDDTFLNAHLLSRDLAGSAHRGFVMGYVIAGAQPVRAPAAKWYTPVSIYPADVYPTYVSGSAYVISGDGIRRILAAAARLPFFWIEDIYVTGMLARAAGLQLIVNGKMDGYRAMPDDCAVRHHIVLHRVSADDMYRLWTIVTADLSPVNCFASQQSLR